jgi:hypothetical protein
MLLKALYSTGYPAGIKTQGSGLPFSRLYL